MGDYPGTHPSIVIRYISGFKKLPIDEQEYVLSQPFQSKVISEIEKHGELRDEVIRDDPNLQSEVSKVMHNVHAHTKHTSP